MDHPDDAEVLHEGDWVRLVRRGRWEFVERTHGDGEAVAIVATTPDERLLFVEQVRIPLGCRTIELPAGLVGDEHAGDDVEDAAGRELVEETGWEAGRLRRLGRTATTPGLADETVWFVRATELRRVGPGGGVGGEDIAVHAIPIGEAPTWLRERAAAGLVLDAKVWTGIWLAERADDVEGW